MCGICAISFTPDSSINARHLTRALLEAIEDRGREATGFASFCEDTITMSNSPVKASDFVKSKRDFDLRADARTVIGHTRLATKGTVANPLNNHPIRAYADSGQTIAAVHNGGVWNDDESFDKFGLARFGQVDSEIIPAMIAEFGSGMYASIFNELEGGIATCWLDERSPNTLYAVRAWDSPMVLADIDVIDPLGFPVKGVIIASTVKALTAGITAIGLSWGEGVVQYEIGEGEFLKVVDGVWDRMVYPFVLPDAISRWSRSRNANSQGYGWGGYEGYDWNDVSPSTGIGSGKVETGKPSTYISTNDGLVRVDDDGTALNDQGIPMALDNRLGVSAAEADEAYTAWWEQQGRSGDLSDVVDRMKDHTFVPTEADMKLLASTNDIERAGLGIDLGTWQAWNDDYTWHMLTCRETRCNFVNADCPATNDLDDSGVLDRLAKVWGFATF